MIMDHYQTERTGKPICWNCSDSKECERGGMMKGPCPVCVENAEKKVDSKVAQAIKIDKRSKEFREAVNNLIAKDKTLSKKAATEILEIEFNKLDK